jgi:hypothetical protein
VTPASSWALVGFDRTADGRPLPRVDEADEEETPRIVARKDGRPREQEESRADLFPKPANVWRDHRSLEVKFIAILVGTRVRAPEEHRVVRDALEVSEADEDDSGDKSDGGDATSTGQNHGPASTGASAGRRCEVGLESAVS